MTYSADDLDHFIAYRYRLRDFMNITLAWQALADPATSAPSIPPPVLPIHFADSVRLVALGWFASLVDPTADSVNLFVVARRFFPHLKQQIRAVEALVAPELEKVMVFRNVVAFHGNKSLGAQRAAREAIKDPAVAKATVRVLDLVHVLLDEELKDPELRARLVSEGFYPPSA